MHIFLRYIILSFIIFFSKLSLAQACYPNQVVTAAFATGGESNYKEEVLWLTWGSSLNNQSSYPYGRHGQQLSKGDKSRASIHLGGNSYLCIDVEITDISGGSVNSYAPGNYTGDSMDKLYNIGGTGTRNKLVCGIINRNDKGNSTIKFKAKATLNGLPIRLTGLAIADAESLSPTEYIRATASGEWNIVDVRKNTSAGSYNIAKRAVDSDQQRIEFQKGNNTNTGAVAFLEFNQSAYSTSSDLSVNFSAELKGDGLTALAIGLLPPSADLGDAPESYGSPYHLIQNLSIKSDGIQTSTSGSKNINDRSYNPGSLVLSQGKFLGTLPPDSDNSANYSKNALGDDSTGLGGINEEDAWPEEYQRFSYKSHYEVGNIISAKIKFKNGEIGDNISGWIDFDLNGTFDENERSSQQVTRTDINNGYVTLNWTVPFNRKVKSTYVRLRYFDKKEDYTSPTQSVNFGEIEDHKMHIFTPKKTNPTINSKIRTK